jgi:hypothetical protein
MYDMLTDRELNVLQHMLFEGTEKAFSAINENGLELNSAKYHRELADLFIEAATELSGRLAHTPVAA